MTWFVVDVEADGRYPGDFSMVSFGVVKVDTEIKTTFYGEVAPISEQYVPEALAVSNLTREQHLAFEAPTLVMNRLVSWLKANSKGRPVFVSDNPAFDYMWINYYLWKYTGDNIFGHSARRIGDIYAGLTKDVFSSGSWRKFRKTKHTHHPVDDARGNVEALVEFSRQYNLKLPK